MASAIKWADECQKVDLPAKSFHVSNCKVESFLMGLEASQTSPLILAASTFLASPSLIDLATSNAVIPSSYFLTAPSGNVMFIIILVDSNLIWSANLTNY